MPLVPRRRLRDSWCLPVFPEGLPAPRQSTLVPSRDGFHHYLGTVGLVFDYTVRLTDGVSLGGGLHLVAFIVFLVVAELAVAFALTRDVQCRRVCVS